MQCYNIYKVYFNFKMDLINIHLFITYLNLSKLNKKKNVGYHKGVRINTNCTGS